MPGLKVLNERNITILDVLIDAARSLQNSEFHNDYTLQGNFALTALLYDRGFQKYERLTRDLDLDYSSKDSWERFVSKCISIFNENSELGLKFSLVNRRGFDKTKNENADSIIINAYTVQGEKFIFKIDMNIKPLSPKTYYTILGFLVEATELFPLFMNKLESLTTIKICRRIKDFYDIYVISCVQDFFMADILRNWHSMGKALPISGVYILSPFNIDELKHAYDRFYGIARKPVFEGLYTDVMDFVVPIFECISRGRDSVRWISTERSWEICG